MKALLLLLTIFTVTSCIVKENERNNRANRANRRNYRSTAHIGGLTRGLPIGVEAYCWRGFVFLGSDVNGKRGASITQVMDSTGKPMRCN